MPAIDDSLSQEQLVRALIYGRPMTKKTWWALAAAEAGFNIIYADFDNNLQVARNLSPEARKRIYRLDMRMPQGTNSNNGAYALMKAVKGDVILYNEETRQYVAAANAVKEPETVFTRLDFSKLGADTILVIDSWTAWQVNLSAAQRNILDPTAVTKPEWEDHAKLRLADDVFISDLCRLNCHSIMIGHVETYVKKKPGSDPKSRTPHLDIETVREQPASATRAHGEQLAKSFTDVLFFVQPQSGHVMIKTNGDDDFDAGSRSAKPGSFKWEDLQFSNLLTEGAAAIGKKAGPLQGITQITGAQLAAERESAKGSATIATPVTTGILNIKR